MKNGGVKYFSSPSFLSLFITILLISFSFSFFFISCKKKVVKGQIFHVDSEIPRHYPPIEPPKYAKIIPDKVEPPREIIQDKRTGLKLAKNQILLAFSPKTSERKVKKIISKLGGKIIGGEPILGIVQVEVQAQTDDEIREKINLAQSYDEVVVATPNFVLNMQTIPDDPKFQEQYWAELINLPKAWDIATCSKSVTVAVIDFGFNLNHEDFEGNVVYYEEITQSEISQDHGTQVMGVIGARGNNKKGIAGVCWDTSLLVYKIDGSIMSLIRYMLDAADRGARVINFSGGLGWSREPSVHIPEDWDVLEQQIRIFEPVFRYLLFSDVVFVQAAGNSGWDAIWSGVGAPLEEEFPNIIIVGSSDKNKKLSSFSSRGSAVKVIAPGEDILTTCGGFQLYCSATGTSLSAGLVSGVAALVRGMRQDLTAKDVKEAILSGPKTEEGYVFLDAEAILRYAQTQKASEKITGTQEKPQISEEPQGELVPFAINRAWTYNPGGGNQSRSSPAITLEGANWVIYYVTSNNAAPYSAVLRKVRDDGNAGTLLWTFSIGTGMSNPSYSSPAIGDDGTVYVASNAGVFAVYPNGTSRWWSPLDSGDTILYNSPTISYDGRVYVTSHGQAKLYAFIGSSGAQVGGFPVSFKIGGEGNIWGSAVVAPDGVIYVAVDYPTSGTGALYAVNPDGTIKWGTQVGRLQATPSIDCDGTIWICSLDTYCRKFNPQTGAVLTSFQIIDADTVELSSCAIVDDKLFFGAVLNNRLHSYFTNGTRRWYLAAGNDFQASPAVSANLSVWAGNLDNNMYVVYDPSRTAESSNLGQNVAVWSSAALRPDGRLYVSRESGSLVAFSSSSDSSGLADAAWPKFKHDNSNTGRLHLCTPQSITGSAISDSQIKIQWTDKTAYETGYKVERCQGAGCTSFSEIGSTGAASGYGSTVTFVDTLLSEYTVYCYRVRAFRTIGATTIYSKYSDTVCIRTKPKAPSGLNATASSDSQINLSWSDNSAANDSYRVERAISGGAYSEIAVLGDVSSYSDTWLLEGTNYCYRVRACVGTDCSDYSNESCAITFPKAPTGPSATANSHTQITFEFWDNSETEEGFKIERRTQAGTWTVIATLGPSSGSGSKVVYVDTGLSPSTSYWYRARAYKGTVFSFYTEEVSATTLDPPATPPAAPSSLEVIETTGTYVKLSWQDNSTDEEGFVVERCQGAGCDFSSKVTFVIAQSNVTQYTDTTISELTTYRYRVYAYNNQGNSSPSNVVETTTQIAEPTNLQVFGVGSTKVYLWWKENSSVEQNIVVERCEGAGCDFSTKVTQVLPQNATDYTWPGLTSETTYGFRVYAWASGQQSQYSNVVYVTLLSPPTNLFANPVLPSQINLSWNDGSSYEGSYKVERCQGAGCSGFSGIANLAANTTSYQDTGLQANTTYCYRVRAEKSDAVSDWSEVSCGTTPNAGVAWTFAVAGAGTAYSSPSTGQDGRIFTTAWGGGAATRGFRAISRAGTSIWGPTLNVNIFSSPASSPEGYVIAGAEDNNLYKRLSSNGNAVCSYNSGGVIRSSPSLFSSYRVIFGSNNNYITVISSGGACTLVGQYLTGGPVISSPAIDIQDRAYVGSDDGKLYALNDVANPIWSYTVGSGWVVRSSPAISCTGDIYFTAQSGTSEIRLFALDYSGNLKWSRTLSTAPPALSLTDIIPSPVIGQDDAIYVSATSGSNALLYKIRDLGNNSQVDWVLQTTGPAISTPAVDRNGNVWFAANTRLHKVVGGTIVWFYSMGTQTVRSSPLISGDAGRVYIIGGDGLLYAFDTDAYPPQEPVWYQFKGNTQRDGRVKGLCRPINLSVNIQSHSTAILSWTRHTIFEQGFYVERAPSPIGPFTQIADLPAGTTQYTDTGLSEGTNYCWRVRSYRGTITSNYSLTICGTTKLGTPTSLNASPQSSTQVLLTWTDNSTKETGYYVERCEGSGCTSFSVVATLGENSGSYLDEGLPEATTWTYRVKAFSSDNESAYSNTSVATTYLHKPTGENAVAVNYQRIEVYWNDNSSKESGYYVERCQGAGCTSFSVIATMPANSTSYIDEPVSPSTTYRYRIRAFSDAGIYSLYSGIVEATTPAPPPSPPDAPSNLTSQAVASTQVNLWWQDNSAIEQGFKIERMPEGATFYEIASVGADVTYYEDTTATCDVYYTYRVRAYNEYGFSNYSNTSTAVPMCAPSSLGATVISNSQIDLTWQDNSTRESKVEVWRSSDGASYSRVAILSANSTSYSDTGLAEATIYWYKVRVTNDTGVSSFSNVVSASTKPNDPSSLTAQPQSASSIKLSWQDNSSGESGYEVERCQGSGCTSFVKIADLPPNTIEFTDTGLSPSTTYRYRVRAYKTGSDVGVVYSGYSNVAEATTYGSGSEVFKIFVSGGVTGTPAIDVDGTIIFGGADGKLYAIKPDGSQKWVVNIGSPILSSPAITCERDVFFGAGNGRLYSVRATDGNINWNVLLGGQIRASPAISNDGEVYVGTTGGVFYAVRATDGTILRRYPSTGNIGAIYTSATIDGANVVFAADDQKVYVLSRSTFTLVCSTAALGAIIRSSPAVDSTGIYVGLDNGQVAKINKSSCAVSASVSFGAGTQVRSSPAVSDYVYVSVISSAGAIVALDKGTLQVVSRMEFGGASTSSPAIADSGVVYVASNTPAGGYLWALTRSGSSFLVSWQFELTGQANEASPAIAPSGNIYIGSTKGLYAVSGTSPLSSSAEYPKFRLDRFNTGGARLCAPSNLQAQAASTSQVDLTWKDNSENEQGFGVERKDEGAASYSFLATAPANATTYSDTTASEGTYYCYRVTAYTSNSVSPYSNEACDLVYPAAPTGLKVETISSSSLTATWYDNSSKEDTYYVERCQGSGCTSFAVIAALPANVTGYQDTGLSEAQTYCYKVRNKRTFNSITRYSSYSDSYCKTTKPATPTSLQANAVTYNRIDLTWQDNSAGESGYLIERTGYVSGSCDASGWTQIASLGANPGTGTMTYQDTTVVKTTTYCYRVRAYKTVGSETVYSEYSNEATATTPDVPIPNTPSGLQIIYQGTATMVISWTDNSNNEEGFGIERCQGAGCTNFAFIATQPANDTDYQDSGLIEATTYCYRVTAYNSYGSSGYSNTACETTQLVAPDGLTTGFSGTAIGVFWNDNSSAEENYLVERNVNNGGWIQIATLGPNTTNYQDTAYVDGVSNCYRVRAKKGSVYSSYSNVSCPTPGLKAPSGLSVYDEMSSSVSSAVVLTWVDNSSGEEGFWIWRSDDGSTFTKVATMGANVTNATIWGLVEGKYYWFKVSAFNSGGESGYSNTISTEAVPYAPSGLTVVSGAFLRTLEIHWQDRSTIETGYEVWMRKEGSAIWATDLTDANTEYYSKEFSEEATYCIKVRAKKGVSKYSSYAGEVCWMALGSPSPLVAEVISSAAIKLTWQDSSTQETGFRIEKMKLGTDTDWVLLTTKSPNSTTHVHSGLAAGTYCYRVRTEAGGGVSSWSNVACASIISGCSGTIWNVDLSGGIGGGITTSAVIDDSSVYVGTSTGYLIAVDVMNGNIRWLKNLGSAVSSHLCASHEGQRTTIFVGTLDGKFHSVDSDGNLIGTRDLGGVVGGCAVKDGKVYLGTTTGWVFVMSKTLSILNSKQVLGAISTAPAIDAIRGSVYFVTEAGKVYAFSLDLTDKWSITVTGTPVIKSSPGLGPKGDIYFGADDGKLYKVSPSGSVVYDTGTTISSAIRSSPVVYVYGSQVTVFVGAENGSVYAIKEDITGTTPSLLWSYSTGSAVKSTAALSQKSVFIGSGLTLYSISIGGGSSSCSVGVLGSITAPVKMKGQIVYVGTEGGRLYAISFGEPQASYSWVDFGNGNGRVLDIHPYRGFAVEDRPWPVSLGTGVGAEIWASPKLYDFDGDEKLEIVILTRGGQVYVLNSDGTVKTGWPKSTGNAIFGTSAIGDIDGDGSVEIVVGNDGGLVYAFDSAGNVKSGFPISVTCKVRFITLANIDSDPENEILFTALNPCNRLYAYDGNGTLKWYYEPGQLMASYPVVNGSGTSAEILITDTNGNVYKFNSSGNLISGWPINLGLSQWLSSPSVGDIDKDGTRDFVVGTTNPVTIYAYDLDGNSKWSLVLQDENGNNLIGYYPRHIVLADIDGDSNLEVIVTVLPYSSGNPGYIYVIDNNGVRMWFKKFSSSPSLAPAVGDFDYDGSQEIAVLTDNGWLYIFESDGIQAQGSPYFLGNNLGGFTSPVFGDIDGDSRLELVFGDKAGYVRAFEFGKQTNNGKKEWYFKKNLKNNANYDEND